MLPHTVQHALVSFSAGGPANALPEGHFESLFDQGFKRLPFLTVRSRDLPLEKVDVSTASVSHTLPVCYQPVPALLVPPARFGTVVLSTAFSVLEAPP